MQTNVLTPPHDEHAEMSVLGGMMISKDAITDAVEILKPQDFYYGRHALIFSVILELFGRNEPADAITVGAELKRRGEIDNVGGLNYLSDLVVAVPTSSNLAYYAEIVREQSMLRALVDAGTKIRQLGFTTDGMDVAELVNIAQAEVYALTDRHLVNDYRGLTDIVPDLLEELDTNQGREDGLRGVPTGFPDLDDKLNGLRPGQMIIVAARPGAGKSTLAMDICRSAAIHNQIPCVYFSLEMGQVELAMRVLSAEASVLLDHMIKGTMSTDSWDAVMRAAERMAAAPMIVDDSPNLTMTEIRAKCRRLKQQHDIQLVVIDYLQLLTSGGKSAESRQQEVSEFSRAIKLLAKEINVPIIAVAQLNRDPEKRNDKRPQVSDLRESGSLEQDADVVMLIHRDDMYDRNSERQGVADIIIGKHRAGPTGTVELLFQGHYSRFVTPALQ